jgi:putative phage-type endonuclease
MIFHNVPQNSPEWQLLRQGKFTASTFKDLFAAKTTAAYEKAIYRVAFEKVTGESPESYSNETMERGHDIELLAKEYYQNENQIEISEGGFYELNEFIGASPDANVGENGLLEVKSPLFNTQINYIISQKLPSIYRHQVQGQLYVTGRQWCDFLAYHPKLKPVIIRVERDELLISEIENKLILCIEDVKKIIEIIKR